MEKARIVVDTNIIFSALISRQSLIREHILRTPMVEYYSPRFVIVELFKHKERLIQATELTENELLEILNALLSRIHFIEEGLVPIGTWMEARRLCGDTDLKDTPFVAQSLHLDGALWTEDAELRDGLGKKGFARFYRPHIR